jgi:signal transduction histidine kinase
MPTSFRRRGRPRPSPAGPSYRLGQFFLDARRHRLRCLNQTAREFLREGIPVTAADLSKQPLCTLTGELVGPNDLPLIQAWKEGSVHEETFVLTREDGSVRHLTWSVAPVRRKDGALRGLTATLVVSHPEPDWEELAGLAHDLRSPLQVLRLLMPILEALPPGHPEAHKTLERINTASDRALELGLDVLNWCQQPMRAGRPLDRGWVQLGAFLKILGTEQTPAAQRKGLTFNVDVGPAEKLEMNTNRSRFARLLNNLLINAIRYTRAGEVRLSARWRGEEKNRVLIVSISDTGAGLSPDEQDSIFQPFTRGRAGTETDSGGSGLGLSVVDRLIHELRLTLEVSSEQGQGSTFDVVVPSELLRERRER